MRPSCIACGNYLLPCTETATGIHPEIVNLTREPTARQLVESDEPLHLPSYLTGMKDGILAATLISDDEALD